MKKIKKEPIYALIEHLYFCEGLEELPFVGTMKPKYMREWSKGTGRKLKDIFWALIMSKDPQYILDQLEIEQLKKEGKSSNLKENI